jgi:hypothetical protein
MKIRIGADDTPPCAAPRAGPARLNRGAIAPRPLPPSRRTTRKRAALVWHSSCSRPVGMVAIYDRAIGDLLDAAAAFHGHLCPGQVLGVPMTDRRVPRPSPAVPQDAGTQHVDHGEMAATFVNMATRDAVRVSARDDARQAALAMAARPTDPRRAQTDACRTMPEPCAPAPRAPARACRVRSVRRERELRARGVGRWPRLCGGLVLRGHRRRAVQTMTAVIPHPGRAVGCWPRDSRHRA